MATGNRIGGTCPTCRERPRGISGYCAPCHAAYVRDWRALHPLTVQQKRADVARAYLYTYIKRGKVTRGPCAVCGFERVLAWWHHGYDHPLDVVWLCRTHHRRAKREAAA